MEKEFKELFQSRWGKYFSGAEIPITYYYADEVEETEIKDSKNDYRCLIGNLNRVREGHTFVYSVKSKGCSGGKRYTGFKHSLRRNFEHFLSYGIPGEMEGERYKKSPELVEEYMKNRPPFKAPGKYLIFKRWDKLGKNDNPAAVIFFAATDVLSGLFTLANYDRAEPFGVIAPMGAGCASIVGYPLEESKSDNPRCILGMFDVSARPYVPNNNLTFTIPFKRFEVMVGNMDESFLITESWSVIRDRLPKLTQRLSQEKTLTFQDSHPLPKNQNSS